MDERLLAWKRRRSAEKCPPRVLQAVRDRIDDRRDHAVAWWVGGAVTACLAGGIALVIGLQQAPQHSKESAPVARAETQVIRDTETSLVCVSAALAKASRASGTIILKETLPSLWQGFETAKQTILKPTS